MSLEAHDDTPGVSDSPRRLTHEYDNDTHVVHFSEANNRGVEPNERAGAR